MNIGAVLILMLFAHIVDDFYLQGILASMKQQNWWIDNAPKIDDEQERRRYARMYCFDYIPALVCHALSWAVMITLPILFATAWNPHWAVYVMLGVNLVIHAVVDDLKANKRKINLVIDQSIHFAQIVVTWSIWAFAL